MSKATHSFSSATWNASQLATNTDRLLACGGFSKRRGPHVAYRPVHAVEPTTCAVPVPPRRSPRARHLVAVAIALIVGGTTLLGVRVTHATPTSSVSGR
jgi:hypothetical protein